jgi:hypothetical protein
MGQITTGIDYPIKRYEPGYADVKALLFILDIVSWDMITSPKASVDT